MTGFLFSSCQGDESKRLQALLVTSHYLARLHPQAADRVFYVAQGEAPPSDLETSAGTKTVQFLFATGANFLMKYVNYERRRRRRREGEGLVTRGIVT